MSTDRPHPEHRTARSELDPRFGKIGISAVAAAAAYCGEQRNTRYAPVQPKDRAEEPAAA